MLYCPKCQATYTDGSRRFCPNEGARLLTYPTGGSSASPSEKGVFTTILKKNMPIKSERVSDASKRSAEESDSPQTLIKNKALNIESRDEAEDAEVKLGKIVDEVLEIDQRPKFEPLPIANIIDPSTIPEKKPLPDVSPQKTSLKTEATDQTGEAELEEQFDDLLEVADEPNPEIPDYEFASDLIEIDPDDPLDTGELFESEPELTPLLADKSDILALPEIELEVVGSKQILNLANRGSFLELDLENNKEVDVQNSIPRIELDLAGLDDASIPAAESEFAEVLDFEELELGDLEVEELDFHDSEVEELEVQVSEFEIKERNTVIVPPIFVPPIIAPIEDSPGPIKASDDAAWEKRSSEGSDSEESRWFLYPLVGVVILGLGLLGFFYLTSKDNSTNEVAENSENSSVSQPNANSENTQATNEELIPAAGNPDDFRNEPGSALLDIAPSPRRVRQPPNTKLYKNEKKNQKGVLAEKFLGFTIYYPKDWKATKSDNKFLDIAKRAPDGLPIKQLLISRYDSNGTFEADRILFADLVKHSNADLRQILANFQVISEGEATIQDGRWRTYEVKFQGIGSDKKLIIWGRRLWIPVQRQGMTSGFIITLIGTSLSKDIKSVEDLGVKDDLAEILKTFEPDMK